MGDPGEVGPSGISAHAPALAGTVVVGAAVGTVDGSVDVDVDVDAGNEVAVVETGAVGSTATSPLWPLAPQPTSTIPANAIEAARRWFFFTRVLPVTRASRRRRRA